MAGSKITLSDAQQEIFDQILNFVFNDDRACYVFSGVAGSGKSSMIKELVSWLDGANRRWVAMTLTGRAASTLRSKGVSAYTIHSVMYEPVIENGKLSHFRPRDPAELREVYNMFIVDEAGMLTEEMFEHIMSVGIPVLFVGDKEQLPPIGDTGFNVMDAYDAHLDEIHRQAEDNPIIQLSKNLRETGTWGNIKSYDPRFVQFVKKSAVTKDFLAKNRPNIIACGTHKIRRAMNALSRIAYGFNDYTPMAGEPIMCLANKVSKESGATFFNGEIYIVQDVERYAQFDITKSSYANYQLNHFNGNIWVPILDDTFITEYHPKRDEGWFDFTYGYCASVWKLQGSQFNTVLVIDEDVSYMCPQKAYRYTAVTRAIDKVIVAI